MINDITNSLAGAAPAAASTAQLFLSASDLRKQCPAAFATKPHSRCSDTYHFVSTEDVIERLDQSGWGVVSAANPVRKAKGRTGELLPSHTGAHMLNFELRSIAKAKKFNIVGEGRARVSLVNSHDRTQRLTMAAGFFRLVCTNGMVAPVRSYGISARHIKGVSQFQLDAQVEAVIKQASQISTMIEDMQATTLSRRRQLSFARKAMAVRFGNENRWRITADQLLESRRPEDAGDDLWHVFNRVQENSTKGGIYHVGSHQPTMPVSRPRQTFRVNTDLWSLAEEFVHAE